MKYAPRAGPLGGPKVPRLRMIDADDLRAIDPQGRLVDDFAVVETERSLHVLNAPSPAATAALSIGDHLAERVRGWFA